MATPRGAQHRDLEQRLRNIEATVRELTGAALRRRQLAVTSGDFAVSGGGSVVLQDGGGIVVYYPATVGGGQAMRVDANDFGGADLLFLDQLGNDLLNVSSGDGTYSSLTGTVDTMQLNGTAQAGLGTTNGGPSVIAFGDSRGVQVSGLLDCFDGVKSEPGTDVDAGGRLWSRGFPTTSNAANVQMTTGGLIQRVQSSIRYKQDVADALVDAGAVLDGLRGRTWRDKAEVAEHPDTTRRYVGYIAEELHDAGLTDYVLYDDEGRPDGIAYDRLTVPLVAVLREQRDELATAKAERDELRAQLVALSARVDTLVAAG